MAPAGSDRANSGHHHLIIDLPTPALNTEIPNDFQHLHFGAGQTETEITLTPGRAYVAARVRRQNHVPHSPPVMSDRIKVKVADEAAPPRLPPRRPRPPPPLDGGRRPRTQKSISSIRPTAAISRRTP